jgi:AcrR family transcriptional regulator
MRNQVEHTNGSTTKDRIEEIALDLFSVHGYKAVSIRDICKKLGFTESSIYYHFANKQAIMDSLLNKIDLLTNQMIAAFDQQFQLASNVTAEEMSMVAVGELVGYLLEPYVLKMISMLSVERMSDPKAQGMYQKIVFKLPLAQHEKVFQEMMNRGIIKSNDAALLSRQYYAIIYLAFQKNCVGNAITPEIIKAASDEVSSGVIEFYQRII